MSVTGKKADICLILEGTYPYVTGGVSGWAHGLIREQSHLSYHLVAIVPKEAKLELKYDLPSNVVGLTTIRLGDLQPGVMVNPANAMRLHKALRDPIANLTSNRPIELSELERMMNVLNGIGGGIGSNTLLDHEEAWAQLVALYEAEFNDHSFLDFFWSYRSIVSSVFSILLHKLPRADTYHALSTGYAGLMAARAKVETGKPTFVTEHGIYTNERRIEVISANWLQATASKALTVDKSRRDLRDMWIDTVNNLSHLCYQASDSIITLFKGNQKPQLDDGADPAKLMIIPNGVDITRFGRLAHGRQAIPTIAMIGRIVPIKDVKTFIRACGLLHQTTPDLRALVIGPTDEDPEYYKECLTLMHMLGLEQVIQFTGYQKVDEYLPQIDLLVLSSISEAQPLVMLEAGAAGIPIVASDVGACREIIEGKDDEDPTLGAGGIVTPLASPAATADAIYTLLSDTEAYESASISIKKRVATYYNDAIQQQAYRHLYGGTLRRA